MAILTYPLNGITYDAEDVEVYMCTRTSGVFAAEGHFPASVSGRTVSIGPGLAWMQNEEFHGKAIYNPETVELQIAEADTYQERKDRIVLQFDKLLNQTTLVVKEGTPASNPTVPEVERDELIYELGLYIVDVPASTVSVSEANIECTFLDESVCGIMEDAVTGIPTQELYDEWYAWFADIQTDTETFEAQFNAWFEDIKEQAEKNMADNQEEFDTWMKESQDDYEDWFENLQDVLDGDVAGHLQNEVEYAQGSADTALDQLATGIVEGFLTDGDGNPLQADDNVEDEAITISRGICDCGEGSGGSFSIDKVYPVGAIYMSVNRTSPDTLFGGTWQAINDVFLLASGSHDAGDVGGAETVALTSSQLPEHTHSLPSHTHSLPSHTHSLPSHTHSFSATTSSSGSHTHSLNRMYNAESGSSRQIACSSDNATSTLGSAINSAGAHTHTVSGTTGSTSGTSGSTSGTSGSTSGTSGSTGSGEAHNNMPPYLTVYMWQRIA